MTPIADLKLQYQRLLQDDASAMTIGTDANPSDNTSAFTSIVIGAFDPNDKHSFPGGEGPTHRVDPGQRLAYRIRFQNTGTASAVNVVVRDTLDSDLAINSFAVDTKISRLRSSLAV